MVVAGLYQTMQQNSKSFNQLPSLSERQMKESLNMNCFFEKVKHKTLKSTYKDIPKTEYHSSFTKVVLPHYTLRNINIEQKHLHTLRIFTFILIAVNSIVLCFDSIDLNQKNRQIIRIIDFSLLLVFYVEIFVKIALQRSFFKRYLNFIDLALLIMNVAIQIYLIIIKCNFLAENLYCDGNIYEFIRVFQVLRILRILVSDVWMSISILILELIKILRKMDAFLMVLLIFLVLFTLMGRELFRFSTLLDYNNIKIDETLQRLNFDNFLTGFFTNFLIFSDEEWHLIMFSHIRAFSSAEAIIYFMSNLIFCTIFLNKVFLAALISNLIESKNIKRMIEGKPFTKSKIKEFFEKIRNFFTKNNNDKKSEDSLKLTERNGSQNITKTIKSVVPMDMSRHTLNTLKSLPGVKHRILNIRKSQFFSHFMMILVIFSLIILAIYDPFQSPDSDFNRYLMYCDIPIFILFTLELLFELIPHENGFFTMTILLKLAVCLLYMFYFIFQMELLKLLLIIRLFLLINLSSELKVAFNALLKSIFDILQLFFFFLLISLLFALIGVKTMKGAFWRCQNLNEEFLEGVINKGDCFDFGGDWVNSDFNFDNLPKALEIMFLIANTEGWLPLMFFIYFF